MASQPKHLLTAKEYLEIESNAQYKSEFFYGEMFSMAGGSINHADIGGNVYHALRILLRGTRCRPYNSDLRVVVDPKNHFAYPDVSIVCGGVQQIESAIESVANPVAILEVLSPTTESHDRGAKFRSYQSMPSLREYFLISQNKPSVERFERVGEGKWTLSYHEGLDAEVPISSVPCELPLTEIYEHIVFETNQ